MGNVHLIFPRNMMTKGGVAVGKIESWVLEFESWFQGNCVKNAIRWGNYRAEASGALWLLESSIYSEFGS
jgi:hypothetical protein